MGKLEDFLLKSKVEAAEETEVVISKRFKDGKGNIIPFRIRSITEAENKEIRKGCQTVTHNKKTRQRETTTNSDLYLSRLIIACTVDPNLKSAELQAHYGVVGAEALLDKMLLPGEHTELLMAVQEINRYSLDGDINVLVDEAKNS